MIVTFTPFHIPYYSRCQRHNESNIFDHCSSDIWEKEVEELPWEYDEHLDSGCCNQSLSACTDSFDERWFSTYVHY